MRFSKRAQQIMKKKAAIVHPKGEHIEFANKSIFNDWLAVMKVKMPDTLKKISITTTNNGKYQAWFRFKGIQTSPGILARDENGKILIERKNNT